MRAAWKRLAVEALAIGVALIVGCGRATPASLATYSAPPPMAIDPNKTYIATIETEKGVMRFRLLPDKAPQTVNNFVFLANRGFYDGLAFHRVVPGFVAEGGAPFADRGGGPGYSIPVELSDAKHEPGALAMARPLGEEESSSSKFYIAYQELAELDGKYTVFGRMIEGMDVLQKLTPRRRGSGVRPDNILSIRVRELQTSS